MLLGKRLRQLREAKSLSQGDLERRSGLLRCYISRVENGYTTPSVETLERLARSLEEPLYKLFHEDGTLVEKLQLPSRRDRDPFLWGVKPEEARELQAFTRMLARMSERNRNLLMTMAQTFAKGSRRIRND